MIEQDVRDFPKVLVTGSRDWWNAGVVYDAMRAALEYLGPFTLISGGARGSDRLCEEAVTRLGLPEPLVVEAEWDLHGAKAGPMRNRQMVAMSPDLGIGFAHPRWKHSGTWHTLSLLEKAGVETWIYPWHHPETIRDVAAAICPSAKIVGLDSLKDQTTT